MKFKVLGGGEWGDSIITDYRRESLRNNHLIFVKQSPINSLHVRI